MSKRPSYMLASKYLFDLTFYTNNMKDFYQMKLSKIQKSIPFKVTITKGCGAANVLFLP